MFKALVVASLLYICTVGQPANCSDFYAPAYLEGWEVRGFQGHDKASAEPSPAGAWRNPPKLPDPPVSCRSREQRCSWGSWSDPWSPAWRTGRWSRGCTGGWSQGAGCSPCAWQPPRGRQPPLVQNTTCEDSPCRSRHPAFPDLGPAEMHLIHVLKRVFPF